MKPEIHDHASDALLSEDDGSLLVEAIASFEQHTGLELSFENAKLCLEPHGFQFNVKIKRWVQNTSIGNLVTQLERLPSTSILVADYVNPNLAERFRKNGILFIDTAGNAFVKAGSVYIFIKGNRLESAQSTPQKKSRAFHASGLRLIFHFLYNPYLLNKPYREISAITGVALGTIGWVINDLKAKGYLSSAAKPQSRELKEPIELLDRWAEAFPERLKPDLSLGVFRCRSAHLWKDLKPINYEAAWSGEVGAYLLDGYLNPETQILYLPREQIKSLVIDHRLSKADAESSSEEGTIWLYEKFWSGEEANGIAPDILVYADLLSTDDPRNLEAARRIYDRIQDRLYGT